MSGDISHIRLGTISNGPPFVVHSVVVTEVAPEI